MVMHEAAIDRGHTVAMGDAWIKQLRQESFQNFAGWQGTVLRQITPRCFGAPLMVSDVRLRAWMLASRPSGRSTSPSGTPKLGSFDNARLRPITFAQARTAPD
jgi:hypothetical protein